MMKNNSLLLLAVVILAVVPFFLHRSADKTPALTASPATPTSDVKSDALTEENELFAGADAQAEAAIGEIAPDYKPWFTPLWEPPSGEIECLLFALQAALGAGILFYYIGYVKGRSAGRIVGNRDHASV